MTNRQREDSGLAAWEAWVERWNAAWSEGQAAAAAVKPGRRFAGAPSPGTSVALDAMEKAAGTPFLAPFRASVTRSMAATLWRSVEPLVNCPEPQESPARKAWAEMRRMLDGIIARKPPLHPSGRGRAARLPLWLICRAEGRVYWQLETAAPLDEVAGSCLTLLWSPDVRPRLRRCATCGRFDLLPRAKNLERAHYCGPVCRKAARPAEDPQAVRERVRQHRARQPRGRRL